MNIGGHIEIQADWTKFDEERAKGTGNDQMGHIKDLYQNKPSTAQQPFAIGKAQLKGQRQQDEMHYMLKNAGWRHTMQQDLANPFVRKVVQDAQEGNYSKPSTGARVYVHDQRPNEAITTDRTGNRRGNHNWMHFKQSQPSAVRNKDFHISPLTLMKSGGGAGSLQHHLKAGAPPSSLGFSGTKGGSK